jgi:hypothetical protein
LLCGDFDVYMTALARDIQQLLAIHEEIAKTPGITIIETDIGRTIIETDIGRTIGAWPTPCQYISTF